MTNKEINHKFSAAYEKEKAAFLTELGAGKFGIERFPNTAGNYQEDEERDMVAFDDYLNSESFKALNEEASK